MRNLIYLFFLGCAGCFSEKDKYFFEGMENEEMTISIEKGDSSYCNLRLRIPAKHYSEVTIDLKSFTYECYYSRDRKILTDFTDGKSSNLDSLYAMLQYSQVLIENKKGDLKLLSDPIVSEHPRRFDTNCMESWLINESVLSSGIVEHTVKEVFIDDLKVDKTDRSVGLYYLYKPSYLQDHFSEQKMLNRSNWIEVE